ncbi:TPA: fimbrial protein [Klebsiella aerogenes]|nr:fimbrial protein [Klebsiella aerogenes]
MNVKVKNRVNKSTALYLAALSMSFFAEMTQANMSVYPMELNVDSSGTAQIRVASKSDDIQFIRVRQKKILNPGTPQEKEVEMSAWKDGGVVVTPEKFALAAGALRIVRLVSLTPPEKESTWRVYFEGVKQPDSILPVPSAGTPASAKLGVNVIWGALVHLAPEKPLVSLRINPASGTLKNDGTLRVPLKEIGACDVNDKCQWFKEDATIYPDTERKLKVLAKARGQKYKFRYFNWINKTAEEADLPVVQ